MEFIGPEPLGNSRGVLHAWDPVKQKLVWRAPGGGGIGGGTVTTAGNLVFQVTNDGHLFAYSADKGEKLLELNLGRSGAGPPVTYQIDGKQCLALVAGSGRSPMNPGPTTSAVENRPLLYVFELDGKAPMPTSVLPPAPAVPPTVH
jgi:quinohemoprotein ethanol dehydrogenase